MTFKEVQDALSEIADALPDGIYAGLNGGIILQPETKRHPKGKGDLYILGEYHNEPYGLGRYITVYYGSFMLAHGGDSPEKQLDALKNVLHHELTHHLENLAGDRSLEKADAAHIEEYEALRARLNRDWRGDRK